MAKKKSESAPKEAAKAAPKKAPPKKQAAQNVGDLPSINTSAAASAAAALIGNKVSLAGGGTARPESSAFKQMKDGLNKPAAGFAGSLLGASPGQKKSNAPFAQTKQVGHNQTFGADVNRTGVPRRTGGG